MSIKEHKKHSDIARPSYGNFSRNEWAIAGTQCSVIQSLADEVIRALSPQYSCTYVDAKHTNENEKTTFPPHIETGAIAAYTDHMNHHEFNFRKEINDFGLRQLFNDADIVLVNGNHFKAKSQVVVIDETKKESLKKRLEQLTNIELILLTDAAEDVFDFIKDFPSFDTIPVYKLNQQSDIIDFFRRKMEESKPLLNGLVLAGGKSKRMGFDKGAIQWHGKEQQYYAADLLKELCADVFISCRPEQEKDIDATYKALPDTFTDLGPFGGIVTAFRENPDAAWMVIACDLPLLDPPTLRYLKDNRNVSSMATAFESPYNHFPEPLITIWEPKSYPFLLSLLSQGISCPGKALRNMKTTVLPIQHPDTLTNVNTPGNLKKYSKFLKRNSSSTMPNDFERYSCQLALPGFDAANQQKLSEARVFIVGAGGLGCPAALYLTASGIGTIGIADYDVVSVSNLHRQVLYTHGDVGLKKSITACKKLQEQNPGIQLVPIHEKITSKNVMEIMEPTT